MNRISSLLTALLLAAPLVLATHADAKTKRPVRHTATSRTTTTRHVKRTATVRRAPATSRPVTRTTTTRTTNTQVTNDPTVWVNKNSDIYHMPGSRWYGKTQSGRMIPLSQARAQGYRPAVNGQ